MTGTPPQAPPPSDTLERLPEDFWNAAAATSEAGRHTSEGAEYEDEVDAGDAPAHVAPGAAVAVLQRLFPGRVLAVEPHPGEAEPTSDAIDPSDADVPAADASDGRSDEAPDEVGLESDRSRG